MSFAAGHRIGSYEILAPIGAGGMGEVYRARDTKLKRDVALKVLPDAFAGDPERMARFQREAEILASLNHPNIAHIYGVEDRALVMELVEGPALSSPLPLETALDYARQIAGALEYAHEKGVIHRDLKPANVKITSEGVVKLLDFGLAKAVEDPVMTGGDLSNSPTLTLGATRIGVILGTAAYMSPEQASGKTADRRADIWSFGAVLYEMLAGKKAFDGESVSDTLASVLKLDPDWNALPSATPASIQNLIRRCLTKDRKQRLQAIGEARITLENPAAGESTPAAPAPRARRWLWPAAAAVFAIAAAGFAALWLRPAPPPQVMRFEIHAPAGSTLPLGTPAITRDGKMLAFTVNDPDGTTRIHIRPIDRIETRTLPGTEGALHPFWSPNGRSLAFVVPNHLKRIDIAGGAARDLVNTNAPWHGDWNQFGDILLAGTRRIPAEGGIVTTAADEKNATGLSFPFFLPDGKRFLGLVQADKNSIQLASFGSGRTLVLDDVDSAPILAPTPAGKTYLLYLRESDLFAQEFDQRSGSLRGQPTLLVSGVGRVANPAIRPALGVSPAGILAYQSGGSQTGQLTWLDRTGQKVDSLPADVSGSDPVLSPDGLSVAVLRPDASGNDNIWITDLTRKSSARLTFGPGRDGSPAWSPDSKTLAFRNGGAHGAIHLVDVHDRSKTQVITGGAGPTSWSPDGKYLLSGGGGHIGLTPLAGDHKPILVGSRNGNSSNGRISPDGKYIAFVSDQSGPAEVYVQPMPPATGEWKISIEGGLSPRWRRDGKELFFLAPDNSMMAVDITLAPAFHPGVPHRLFQLKTASRTELQNYDVRADGKQFLMFLSQGGTQDNPITVVLNWWVPLQAQPARE